MVYECDKCEAALPPNALFCPRCGQSFDNPVPADAAWEADEREPAAIPASALPAVSWNKPGRRRFLTWALASAAILLILLLAGAVLHSRHAAPPDEGRAYVVRVHDHSARISQCLYNFGALYGERSFDDPDWIGNLDANLRQLKLLSDEGKAIQAPAKYKDVQQQYTMAMEDYAAVADTLPDALRRKDQARQNDCLQRLRDAQQSVGRAQALLEKVPEPTVPSS